MKILALLLGLTGLLTGLLTGARAAPPHPPPRADWMSRACLEEDGVNCFWNAGEQGDGRGHSFYTRRFPGGPTCVMYVDPTYARAHDGCG